MKTRRLTYAEGVAARVEALVTAHEAAVRALAAEARERLVVPLCRRRGYGFMAGNGDFFFHKECGRERVHYGYALDTSIPAEIRRVLEVLMLDAGREMLLGYYVEDVDVAPT